MAGDQSVMNENPVAQIHHSKTNANWQVYIILCSDDSLYTGITTDIERRFRQHACGRGAKYFLGRRPLQVVYLENDHSRCSAASRELHIKAMKRAEKLKLVTG